MRFPCPPARWGFSRGRSYDASATWLRRGAVTGVACYIALRVLAPPKKTCAPSVRGLRCEFLSCFGRGRAPGVRAGGAHVCHNNKNYSCYPQPQGCEEPKGAE